MANPFQTQLGSVPTFKDNRQLVQDNSALIREREDQRQTAVDLEKRLANVEANANMFNALGSLGIRIGEIASVNAFYGSADNEAEAIAQIEEQGFQMSETINTMSELAQARAGVGGQNGLSYTEAQNKMSLLLRNAKNDNPLFAYVFDEAAAKFVNGTPTGRGAGGNAAKGTLASLSIAEQAERDFMAKAAAIKMNAPSLSDQEVENYLHNEQLRAMDMERRQYQQAVSGDTIDGIQANFGAYMSKLSSDAWIELATINDQYPTGMPTEVKQSFALRLQQLRIAGNQYITESISLAENNSNGQFTMGGEDLASMQTRLNSEIDSLQAFLDDADFNKNMVSIQQANEAAFASYIMTNHPEFHFTKEELYGGDAAAMTLARESNPLLEETLRQSPTLKAMFDDYGMTSKEGINALINRAHHNVFTKVLDPNSKEAGGADMSSLPDVNAVVSSQVSNPELADRSAELLKEGGIAVNNLANAAAADPDVAAALTSMPAYIERGNMDRTYAQEVLAPIVIKGADGVVNSILVDNAGRNPEIEIEWVGHHSESIKPNPNLSPQYQDMVSRWAKQQQGYHLKVDGISKQQENQLNELYTSLQTNPNILDGVGPESSVEEIRDAAQKWLQDRLSPVLPVPVTKQPEE